MVECVVRMVGCVGAIVCNGLNSLPSVGGKTVAGTAPGNVGDTTMKIKKRNKLINYLFVTAITFKFRHFQRIRIHFIRIMRFYSIIHHFAALVQQMHECASR